MLPKVRQRRRPIAHHIVSLPSLSSSAICTALPLVKLTSTGKRNGETSGLSHSATGDRHDHSLECSRREPRLDQFAILDFVDGQRSCCEVGGWCGGDEDDALVRQQ